MSVRTRKTILAAAAAVALIAFLPATGQGQDKGGGKEGDEGEGGAKHSGVTHESFHERAPRSQFSARRGGTYYKQRATGAGPAPGHYRRSRQALSLDRTSKAMVEPWDP